MSYLVLARKWRPRRFSELVGQEHVVRALTNALESGRVHHAFLFTGTRGIGKTTIARIFAKSLNCVRGIGAEPCGECEVCTAVDEGRFVDLLEIDAASNTGVDDVREVIENAQYLPTRGRYKVYLIDEVHMLSKAAFNALLKTLEEPPEHVKFLLATTDPQKLPVTVLSRCLQFNLRRLSPTQIAGQMRHILDAEQVDTTDEAIALLADAADGSLRDGLSLLDQALAFGGGRLLDDDVRSMLGSVDRAQIGALLDALANDDGATLMQVATDIAGFSPDFSTVLDALALALHRIQLHQLVPGVEAHSEGVDVPRLAAAVDPETIQIWYQMALLGGRDVELAPSAQVGFEMTLLRMLAFCPINHDGTQQKTPTQKPVAQTRAATPPRPVRSAAAPPAATGVADRDDDSTRTAPRTATESSDRRPKESSASASGPINITDNESWLRALQACEIAGPTRELGANLRFVGAEGSQIQVFLPPSYSYLRSPPLVQGLSDALCRIAGGDIQLAFTTAPASGTPETLGERNRREAVAREEAARDSFANDPVVRELTAEGATIRLESVRPRDAN